MSENEKETTVSVQKDESTIQAQTKQESASQAQTKQIIKREDVIYKLRDINGQMVDSWKVIFGSNEKFEV